MPSLSYPSSKNLVTAVQAIWTQGVTKYNPSWPFPTNIRCVTKGEGKKSIEVFLEHNMELFTFVNAERDAFVEGSPYGILRALAREGRIADSMPSRNWAHLWFTMDDGNTYVRGDELRKAHAAHFNKPLIRTYRHSMMKARLPI